MSDTGTNQDEVISWNDIDIEAEEVTKEEAEDIKSGPDRIPWGKFEATIIESTLKQMNFDRYSCIGVKISLRADKWIEVEGQPVTIAQQNELHHKIQYDDIALYNPAEKEGMAKHRKAVALRLGLIRPGEQLTKEIWQKGTIGIQIVVETEKSTYTDKRGKEKEGFPEVLFFDGYSQIPGKNSTGEQPEWGDI